MTTLEERIAALEAQAAANQLPASFAALQRKLEQNWQPDAAVLLQAGSVTPTSLAQIPHARVYNSAAITLTTGVTKILTFDNERWDTSGLHSTTANTSRLTAPIAGLYDIGAGVEFAVNAAGFREAYLLLNGLTPIEVDTRGPTPGQVTNITISGVKYRLAAGDYVEVAALQTSGGNLNVTAAGNYSPEFWMTYLSS